MRYVFNRTLVVLTLGTALHANAQTVSPPASKATLLPSKPIVKPVGVKPGSGMTANVAVIDSGSGSNGDCTVGDDSMVDCHGTSSSNSDGFYGAGLYGGGGTPNTYPAGGTSKADGSTGGGVPEPATEDPKLTKIKKCEKIAEDTKLNNKEEYDRKFAQCAADYPDNSGALSVGVQINGSGFSISIPADWLTSNARKRIDCQNNLKSDLESWDKLADAVKDSCKIKAANGQ